MTTCKLSGVLQTPSPQQSSHLCYTSWVISQRQTRVKFNRVFFPRWLTSHLTPSGASLAWLSVPRPAGQAPWHIHRTFASARPSSSRSRPGCFSQSPGILIKVLLVHCSEAFYGGNPPKVKPKGKQQPNL